jgi:serine/threonine protein kinase
VDPERWRKIEVLFEKAQGLAPGQRASLLAQNCGGDQSLRQIVESLLLHEENAGQFLERRAAVRQLEPGQRLSRYEVQEKLGEGGMGVVYRAYDAELLRLVAIKVLPPEYAADPGGRDLLHHEARAASALSHPNIVGIHEVGSANGVDFIAMEFVEGRTLDEAIPAKGLPLRKALDYAVQIAGGLARAHASGVVHRDLKPGNIMVARDGVVKLLDFGLARRVRLQQGPDPAVPVCGELAGTPGYMAPEQLEGMPLDARSDIFSFGVVLYQMLTGRKPFSGDSAAAVMAAVLREEPAPIGKSAPAELEKIVKRCLRKDPDRRWQAMPDLRLALLELYEGSSSEPAGTATKPVKRRRRVLIGAAGLALLVAGGLLFLANSGFKSPTPTLVQLTSYAGNVQGPSFSPDGNQVAFAWNGQSADNFNIWVKMVGETNPRQLTSEPAPELSPAWSPDGKHIALQRNRPGAPGIWLVSPLGSEEQKLADLRALGPMSWSPDSKWLALARGMGIQSVVDGDGILLVPANGGEQRRITNPKAPAYDFHPSFSPNGRELAYASCHSAWSCDVFVQPLNAGYSPQGNARRITREGLFISGVAWSRDGGSLIYGGSMSWGMTFLLWRVNASGRQRPERVEVAGLQPEAPSISAAGNRLAFIRPTTGIDIWRYQSGGVPEPLVRSSLADYNPQFSPDGSRIAFASARSGDLVEIWAVNADSSNPVQLTRDVGRGQGCPRWSPDGRLIAFDSLDQNGLSRICVIEAGGGRPNCLSSGKSNDNLPSWSLDGKSVYFASDRTGRYEIWRVPAGGGPALRMTDNGGFFAFESTDRRGLFYTKTSSRSLFTKLLDGGPERKVLDTVFGGGFVPVEDGIFYLGDPGSDRQHPIQFYNFSTGTSRLLTKVKGPLGMGLSVSPDRNTILFT